MSPDGDQHSASSSPPPPRGPVPAFALGLGLGALLAGAATIGAASLLAARTPAPVATIAIDPEPVPTAAPVRRITVGVFGDSMADGLWAAMFRELHADKSLRILRYSHPSTGLVRYDFRDVGAQTAEQVAAQPVDVAIVMIGTNDKQGMMRDGAVLRFDSEEWRALYARRMRDVAGTLRRSGAAVFWVGLPRMRSPEFDESTIRISRIQEANARAMAIPFIPTAPVTADAAGAYSPYGDTAGEEKRLLRAGDGIHMTLAGYERVAAPVIDHLRGYLANVQVTAAGNAFRPLTLASAASGAPEPQ